MNYYMVPSLKLTLITWVAFIGLGLLSLGLKAKNSPASFHHTKAIVAPTSLSLNGELSTMITSLTKSER